MTFSSAGPNAVSEDAGCVPRSSSCMMSSRILVASLPAGQRLPEANSGIDISRVKFQPTAAPAGALGRDYRRTAAKKAIEHDVAAGRAVEDRIGDHCHRLDCRVQRQQIAFLGAAGEGVEPGIAPDIAAVAAELTELDVVAVVA